MQILQDKSGKCLTEEKEILSRWTEYCSELYNYESCGDNAVLDCSQPPEEVLQPILREEVEIAVASLKKGKSAGVDNIPAELVQAGGETMIDVLTEICNRIWRTGQWPTPWTQSLIITLPKKGNLQLCQNYRTISLISHSSKVMLKVILNRLKPQAEEIIAEEQAGFRAGRSTTEQIFNLRILCEKYLQHQQNLYHVFIDFKKAFDRVWHAALWATMRKYNISANLVRTIEQLYDKATSAVQMNGSIGEWFRTTVGVRQGCLLSPTLFNIFLERIMSDALEEHDGKVSIGGRNITNLRFADDIDALAEEEQELEALVESLDKTCTRYKMEISVEKTKLMTNSANGIQREIKVKGQKLGTRVRTEIGNQNSRTFPGLFKDYLHFFQESFFIDGNSPNTAYTQDFCPIQDRKRISLSGSLFLPNFSSAYCLCTLLSFLPFPDFRFVRFHFRLHSIRIT